MVHDGIEKLSFIYKLPQATTLPATQSAWMMISW
jgi:hypothetical protein